MNHNHHEEQSRHEHDEAPAGLDRRSFLKLAGFSFAGIAIAGCNQAKVEKAIPFLIQPEEITPGLAYWYATTCSGCNAHCGMLVKSRDGRPIKVEGNPAHPLSQGGLCAIGQASLLGLYDSQRLKHPLINGKEASWDDVDAQMNERLARVKAAGGAVRFLTGTVASPTTRAMIARFLGGFKDAKHIEYDAISCSAILDAHEATHERRVLPRYRFERAEVVVSFDADFLGTWISPIEFTKGYRSRRTLEGAQPSFSHHTHIESRVSLTGSNADERIRVSHAEMHEMLRHLTTLIAAKAGKLLNTDAKLSQELATTIDSLATRLWDARGKSLVVCGVNTVQCQILVNTLNALLGNYGQTVDVEQPSHQYAGNDAELIALLDEIKSGKVTALFIADANPVYDLPNGSSLRDALKKIPLVVSFADRVDETAESATFVCPQPHPFEAWRDFEPAAGVVSVAQPTIQPLMNTRHLIESLSVWSGTRQSALDLIRGEWEKSVFERQSGAADFSRFWTKTLEDGFAEVSAKNATSEFNFSSVVSSLSTAASKASGELTVTLVPSLTMFDGRHAHNAWLHELADPVTKTVWDNCAWLSRRTAETLGVGDGDVVQLKVDGATVELPTHIQPGQHDSVVVVSLGYGRKGTDRFTSIGPEWIQKRKTVEEGELVGKNAAVLVRFTDGARSFAGNAVAITKTDSTRALAKTQEYDSLHEPNLLGDPNKERRPIIQETTFAAYATDHASGSFHKEQLDTMWSDDHKYTGHHWGMVIDLNACTGCSACVVSCQAENNIPVVGKDEVRRNREMAWLRIDRYYDEADGQFSVAHQPMMCQHCGNAPCETVCPVLATVHNDEGLNQQVYNRCVGTRYCANNCPYKVRRFNWFEYRHGDEMHKMVLNPDVTVRDRGVMEKCSFCVQRIQLAKIDAKKDGRKLKDGDAMPACAQSCPANAIVFGDMNDPESEIVRRMKDARTYRVLEELGVRPSVSYMTLIRNREEKKESHHA
ncbi:MAG: 4Fe-4S dicluster domain-containing protein [Ignavibacteriae bacterium]|nr:4Fe-4S dicluster domain-containing protein [Ignavibacteriota bacterium]